MIDNTFLTIKFTEVTLLHILILIGIPYIIFYFFERYTKFDKFPEKWELGLFIFVFGGLITFISLLLQNKIGFSFWFTYVRLIIILLLSLFIIGLILSSINKEKSSNKWVLIKLKNGQRFKGIIQTQNNYFIKLVRDSNHKILKIDENNKERALDWEYIHFNISEVLAVYTINLGR